MPAKCETCTFLISADGWKTNGCLICGVRSSPWDPRRMIPATPEETPSRDDLRKAFSAARLFTQQATSEGVHHDRHEARRRLLRRAFPRP